MVKASFQIRFKGFYQSSYVPFLLSMGTMDRFCSILCYQLFISLLHFNKRRFSVRERFVPFAIPSRSNLNFTLLYGYFMTIQSLGTCIMLQRIKKLVWANHSVWPYF